MSNTINNQIPLTQIIAPSLSDVNYASGLNDVFDNINDNFSTLSNHDFIKGESGTSVKIQEDKFFNENGSLTILGQKLKYCINSLSDNEDEYDPVIDNEGNSITVFDYFDANPGVLYMVYNTVNDVNTQTPVAISSLYYVFLDGRYATTKIGMLNESQYTNIKDFSCVLVYDANVESMIDGKPVNGGFKALTTAFPTIYYESNVGLCWKVNGNGTGIPVQGVPGRNGLDTNLQIVKGLEPVETENHQFVSNITSIYGLHDGFIEFDHEEDYSYLHGKAALILAPNKKTKNDNSFYFGMLEVKGDVGSQEVRAYCDQSTSINYSMATETMINVMKDINIVGGDIAHTTLPGLFIPMESRGDSNTQKVHLMAATSLTNTKGQTSDLKTDLMYTPISDINNFDVAGSDEENGNQLIVDKYLYVKINENTNFGIDNKKYSDEWLTNRRKFGGYLKYKLVSSISSIDSPYMGYFNSSESLENIGGSKIRTNVYYRTLLQRAINGDREWDKHKYIFADEHNIFKNNGVDTANGLVPAIKSINCQTEIDLQFKCSLTGTAYITESEEFPDENDGILQYVTGNEDIVEDKFLLPVSWFVDDNRTTLKSNIYRWVLCDHVDEFDIDELHDNYKYIDGVDSFIKDGKYLFENEAFKNFAVILTNTMCPTYDSEILWFNSLNVLGIPVTDAMKVTNDRRYEDVAESTLIVAGWQSNAMQFVKFVPVYRNSYAVDVDTAFNINYNVNITGDGNKSTKSLTVHGGINCDDLSVYKLTATGEIKNIFTQEDITGCAGILLGRYDKNDNGNVEDDENHIPDYDYNFKVDSNGKITATNINIENVNTNNVDCKQIHIGGSTVMKNYSSSNSYSIHSTLMTITPKKYISTVYKDGHLEEIKGASGLFRDYYLIVNDNAVSYEKLTDCADIDINNAGSINLSTQQGKTFVRTNTAENTGYYIYEEPINTINSNMPVVMTDKASIMLTNVDKTIGNKYLSAAPKTKGDYTIKNNLLVKSFAENNKFSNVFMNNINNIKNTEALYLKNIEFSKNPNYSTRNINHGSSELKNAWHDNKEDGDYTNYMISFEISEDDFDNLKENTEYITISFDKAIDFQIGVRGENSYASHPYLCGDSCICPRVWVNNNKEITHGETGVFPTSNKKCFGDMYMTHPTYDSHGGWVGSTDISSWRFYTFVYYVPKMNIPVKTLKNNLRNGKVTVTIGFYIYMHLTTTKGTWGYKAVIYDAIIRSPVFSNRKNDFSSNVHYDSNTNYTNNDSNNPYHKLHYQQLSTVPVSGSYFVNNTDLDIKILNIANDGIIMRGDGKLFGLSFTKPQESNNYPSGDKEATNGSDIYMYIVEGGDGNSPNCNVLKLRDLCTLTANINQYGL